jgi:hypothetical protein
VVGVVTLNIVERISVLTSVVQEIQPNYRPLRQKVSRHKIICGGYETQILQTSTVFI